MIVKFSKLAKIAFWIGLTGYGGPALVGIMKKKFVEETGLITEQDFLEGLSLTQILPGAISVTLIGYLGYKLKGFWGVVLLPVFFLLPSVCLIIFLSWAYIKYGNLNIIQTLFIALGALVVALLVNATKILGKSIFGKIDIKNYKGYLISLIISFIGYFFRMNVVFMILAAGLLGIILFSFGSEYKNENTGNFIKDQDVEKRKQLSFFKNITFYFFIFALILLILAYFYIPILWKIFYVFFNIGLFGFGGGYTVIPLIQHHIVQELHWLTLTEFRDGIALGQITPGPVYITATFIGYKIFGLSGAIVATIASFSPSLLAVVILGKLLLKIRHKKIVQTFIKGILSGFIGLLLVVILNFGLSSLINWQTWLIFIVSIIIIIFLKKDPIVAILVTLLLALLI